MKKFFILLMILLIAVACDEEGTAENEVKDPEIEIPEGYTLAWNDEFELNSIDTNKWEHEVNATGGGNNELQYYTAREENSFVKDGKLHLVALEDYYEGDEGLRQFSSARIRTLNKGDWKYGRFEIRAKLPKGQGLWPAIWMLPTDGIYGNWAASGEIDIMELLGQDPTRVYGTLHHGGTYPDNVHIGENYVLPSSDFSSDFHVFRFEWEQNEMRWYVDDVHYATQNSWYTKGYDYPAPYDQRFHMILNVAVGGNWPGSPDETTTFPQEMVVDYVRVFKKD